MWFKKDYRWMLPLMGFILLGMIVVTNWPKAGVGMIHRKTGKSIRFRWRS